MLNKSDWIPDKPSLFLDILSFQGTSGFTGLRPFIMQIEMVAKQTIL